MATITGGVGVNENKKTRKPRKPRVLSDAEIEKQKKEAMLRKCEKELINENVDRKKRGLKTKRVACFYTQGPKMGQQKPSCKPLTIHIPSTLPLSKEHLEKVANLKEQPTSSSKKKDIKDGDDESISSSEGTSEGTSEEGSEEEYDQEGIDDTENVNDHDISVASKAAKLVHKLTAQSRPEEKAKAASFFSTIKEPEIPESEFEKMKKRKITTDTTPLSTLSTTKKQKKRITPTMITPTMITKK